jgi:hypothetical protein
LYDSFLRKVISAENRCGDRRRSQAFGTPLGRNHHLLELVAGGIPRGIGGRLLRPRPAGDTHRRSGVN